MSRPARPCTRPGQLALLLVATVGACQSEEAQIRERIFANTDYLARADSIHKCPRPEPISHSAWMATHASLNRALALLEGGYADAALEEAAHGWTLAHEYENLLRKRGCRAQFRRDSALAAEQAAELDAYAQSPAADADFRWLHLIRNSPYARECGAKMPAHELEEIEGLVDYLADTDGSVTLSTIAAFEAMRSSYAQHQCGRTLLAHWRETLPPQAEIDSATGGTP